MVRLIKRDLRASSLLVLIALTLSACGGPSVSLSSQPDDLSHARALAQQVADQAGCGSFEDLSQGDDYWVFTCQSGGNTYDLVTASNTATRDSRVQAYRDMGLPVKVGNFFVVSVAQSPGQQASASDLDTFPGDDAE